MTTDIRNTDDVIDSRDIIARIEELRGQLDAEHSELENAPPFAEWLDDTANTSDARLADDAIELIALQKVADQCEGYGDWEYGETLISADYFVEYCEDLVKDIDALPRDIPAYVVVDWEATAENLKVDYMSVDFDGHEYWMRS